MSLPQLSTPADQTSPFHELSDETLLQLLLHGRTVVARRPLRRLLSVVGSLSRLWQCDLEQLTDEARLAPRQAARLLAALELGRRSLLESTPPPRFDSHQDVCRWALPRLAHLDHEELWLLSLDGRNCLKRADRVAQGGLHGCAVTPRDVLRPAVRNGASAVVAVHNHPSGDPTPSADDLAMTERLAHACDVVSIPLLDHVVVARGGSCSIAELGVFDVETACDTLPHPEGGLSS